MQNIITCSREIKKKKKIAAAGITLAQKILLGRFWRALKSCQYPGHTGKVTSLAGKHVINFQMADEICFLFGKTITAVGSRKCNTFFLIVKLHSYILLFLFAAVSRNDAFPKANSLVTHQSWLLDAKL